MQESQPQPAAARCVYDVDPEQMEQMLRARGSICRRYGPTQIICDADTSQPLPVARRRCPKPGSSS